MLRVRLKKIEPIQSQVVQPKNILTEPNTVLGKIEFDLKYNID